MLSGEAGIGKTALLAAFAEKLVSSGRRDRRVRTLRRDRCIAAAVPEHPRRVRRARSGQHLDRTRLRRHGGELLRICPALSKRVTTTPAPTGSDDATERFLAFEAASDVLSRIAQARPLVVMLDDLQWAEPTTLLLLRHVARALADVPALLVLSSRDPGEHESEALRYCARRPRSRRDTPPQDWSASPGASSTTWCRRAEASVDQPEPMQIVEALRAQTAGNPLFASQLIRHWTEAGFDRDTVPPSLRDVVWSRVNAIGDDATEVLTAASVLGVDFYEDVLLDMVGLPEPVVIDTLDAAARGGLLIDAGIGPAVAALRARARRERAVRRRRAALDVRACTGSRRRASEKSVEELPPSVVVQLARHCALAG